MPILIFLSILFLTLNTLSQNAHYLSSSEEVVLTDNMETPAAATDTFPTPVRVDEALIQQLINEPYEKTWRDSGYYFQLESVIWQAIRLGNSSNGDLLILASFSSSDASSLVFRGRAVFRIDPLDWPDSITPSRGLTGEAVIAFPQDVLLCPSPSQEIGLGQNDPYFPLYLTGEITGIAVSPGDLLSVQAFISVQLRDMEIIL